MATDASRPATLLTRSEMSEVELQSIGLGTAAVISVRSPGGESGNEDAAALIPLDRERAVIAVADGMGGQPGGEEAAALSVEILAKNVQEALEEERSIRAAVLDAFDRANLAVTELGSGAATTLAAVEIEGPDIRPYHAGDSMILVVGQRGRLKLKTVSHSPVGYAVEAGLLEESDAIHHEDRHLVSNMVGSPELRIEVGSTLRLGARDTLVLASDGLFDNLHIEEIVELVRKGPLERACEELVATARRRMCEPESGHPSKPDDLTFVLFRLG